MDEAFVRWSIEGLAGVVLLMFGGMIRRLFNKQDELERTKANKESSDARFDDLLTEIRLMRTDFRAHESEDRSNFKDVLHEIREQNQQWSQTNGILQNLAGRVDAALKAANFGATNGQR